MMKEGIIERAKERYRRKIEEILAKQDIEPSSKVATITMELMMLFFEEEEETT